MMKPMLPALALIVALAAAACGKPADAAFGEKVRAYLLANPEVLEEVAASQRPRAVQLDGRVDDVLRGLGGQQLRHRGAPRDTVGPFVVRRRRRVHHQPGRLRAHRHLGDLVGQVFALMVLTVAAAEAAIGLAILVTYFRNRGTIAVEDINLMKG